MHELHNRRRRYGALRRLAWFVAPHGFVQMRRRKRRLSSTDSNYELAKTRLNEFGGDARAFDYEDAVAFVEHLGAAEHHVRGGSVSRDSIDFVVKALTGSLPSGRSSLGLHIGNYLGVSLVAIAAAERARHPDSLVVGIDPNLPHRGTAHNQDRVCRLIDQFGLGENVMLICGYSGEKAPSNTGWIIDGYDPAAHLEDEAAPRATLRNLGRLLPQAVDWALVDGNHEGGYLGADLASLAELVRPGGLVFIDDCSNAWPEIKRTFDETAAGSDDWTAIAWDGRVGVLMRRLTG